MSATCINEIEKHFVYNSQCFCSRSTETWQVRGQNKLDRGESLRLGLRVTIKSVYQAMGWAFKCCNAYLFIFHKCKIDMRRDSFENSFYENVPR